MPRPTPRSYDPQTLGANCSSCPLRCKGMLPVPPRISQRPKFSIVAECPGGQEKFSGQAFTGNASAKVVEDLQASSMGPNDYSVFYRIACCPSPKHRVDSTMRKAANACLPRLKNEITLHGKPNEHQLFLGKWAPVGVLRSYEEKHALEIKLTKNVVRNRAMVLSHPSLAYFNRPAGRAQFRQDLQRWCEVASGKAWPTWDEESFHLEPSEESLAALRSMGPVIGFDIESHGSDPMSSPLTVIGISDGTKTVSLGWCSYGNSHGYYQGIADSSSSLAKALRAEIKRIFESNRVKVAHNATHDYLGLEGVGIKLRPVVFDTLDAYKTINPEMSGGLEHVCAHLLRLPTRWKTLYHKNKENDLKGCDLFTKTPREELIAYNARDTVVLPWLYKILIEELAKED